MKTAGIEFIRAEMDWDKYDAWGSVMNAVFDLCEAWWHSTGIIVNGYRPSVLLEQGEPENGSRVQRIYDAFKADIINTYDYVYWVDVLNRMRALVIQAGRDY